MGILHKRISNPTGANILREKRKEKISTTLIVSIHVEQEKKKNSSARSDISLSRLLKLRE